MYANRPTPQRKIATPFTLRCRLHCLPVDFVDVFNKVPQKKNKWTLLSGRNAVWESNLSFSELGIWMKKGHIS